MINLTEIFTVRHHILHLFPGHAPKFLTAFSRKNIAVLAALVAFICNMPLKSEVLTHPILSFFPRCFTCAPSYLSDAPQALPHAAGFSSGLSFAPQALPHAAGFSSGLPFAPQAVPHAALAFVFSSSFHPAMFVNAMSLTSCYQIVVCCCKIIIPRRSLRNKYALFYYLGTKK
jgi:hypothetical protein